MVIISSGVQHLIFNFASQHTCSSQIYYEITRGVCDHKIIIHTKCKVLHVCHAL